MSSANAQDRSIGELSGHNFAKSVASQLVSQQSRFGADIVGRTLEAGLIRSRNTAREDSKPIPEKIRNALFPFYSHETLDKIRYTIGDVDRGSLAAFAIRNGDAAAVTLIDTIVFASEDYVENLALWAHEIHHVEQYSEWGTDGFAQRYAFGWRMVEEDARAKTQAFIEWYNDHADR